MRLIRAVFVLAFLCLALKSASAQRSDAGVFGETHREYWQFGPFFSQTTAPGQREMIFHPLYSRYEDYERGYNFSTVLYPVYYNHGTHHWKKWSLLYIFSGDSLYHEDKKEDTDLLLSPLFYWGRGDTEKERYFSVFPFYGRIKDKFAHAEISYVMFPLYSSWTYGRYTAHGILWPLVMWGSSPTRSDLRIFPFYSHKIHRGKYDRRTVLWPFIQWGQEDLDKKEPRGYFLFWPIYGRKWSRDGNLSVHSIMPILGGWPLIAAWGSDKKTDSFDFKALLFLIQRTRSKDPYINKFFFIPFYGFYDFGNFEDESTKGFSATQEGYFITPFYASLKTHSVILESEYTSLFPVYIDNKRYYRKERESENYLKIWPLFNYSYDSRGNTAFRMITLLPWRSDTFEKVWGPYYSLVEYNRFENGDRYFSLFFRLYSQYWNANEFHLYLLGLFELHLAPDYWSVKLLGGVLGYRYDYGRVVDPPLETPALGRALARPPPDPGEIYTRPGESSFYLFWMRF